MEYANEEIFGPFLEVEVAYHVFDVLPKLDVLLLGDMISDVFLFLLQRPHSTELYELIIIQTSLPLPKFTTEHPTKRNQNWLLENVLAKIRNDANRPFFLLNLHKTSSFDVF